jgi:GNAT superfamily N-acetyltransferase
MERPTPIVRVRGARRADARGIFALIRALAEFEKLSDAVTGNQDLLADHLFGPQPCIEALVAEAESAELVGFALFFTSYSTFLTRPGLYLEDLFVLESHRRQGIGRALLAELARLALQRQSGRVEWSVLDWNANAISFYQSLGARVLPDWRTCRVTDDAISALARSNG